MESDSLLLCPGGWCPLRYTCRRYIKWMAADEDADDLEMDPAFDNDKCESYLQVEYYGQ